MCTCGYLVVTVVVDTVDDDDAVDDVVDDDVDLRSIDSVWRRSIKSMVIQFPAPRSVVGKIRKS